MIAAQLTVAGSNRRSEAAGKNHGFVFFLRRTNIVPERTVLSSQQMIRLRRVRQIAAGNKGFPRRARLGPQFVEENLLHAFLQKQFINRCIS